MIKRWNKDELEKLYKLKSQGLSYSIIAKVLNREIGSIKSQFYYKKNNAILRNIRRSGVPINKKIQTEFNIILTAVSKKFDIKEESIKIETRKKEVVLPRQYCHYLAYYYTDAKVHDIGHFFGNKSHGLVIHSKDTLDSVFTVSNAENKIIKSLEDEIRVKFKNIKKNSRNETIIKKEIYNSNINIHQKILINELISLYENSIKYGFKDIEKDR